MSDLVTCNFSRALLIAIVALLSYQSELFSQHKNEDLENSINDLVETLESSDDRSPKHSMALKIARQIRLANDTGDVGQIRSARSALTKSSLDEHKRPLSGILERVEKGVSERHERLQKEWLEKIDSFARDTEIACLNNATVSELLKLLADSDSISPKPPHTGNSTPEWINEFASKLSSASNVLKDWISYKRFREKGYTKQAVDRLASLSSASPSVPILDKSFIDKEMAPLVEKLKHENSNQDHLRYLSQVQLGVIQKLTTSKLEANIFLNAADQLEMLSESHDSEFPSGTALNAAIGSLADCLLALKTNSITMAQHQLSLFYDYSAKVSKLDGLRRNTILELTPKLYLEVGPEPPRPNQSVQSYLLQLISKPKSGKEVNEHQQLIGLYRRNIPSGSAIPQWIHSAELQYSALLTATSSMNAGDYGNALKNFRIALTHAPKAGPAAATEFIEGNLKKILALKPEISDPSISDILERLQAIEKKLDAANRR